MEETEGPFPTLPQVNMKKHKCYDDPVKSQEAPNEEAKEVHVEESKKDP